MGHSTGTALFVKQKKNGQTKLSLLNLTVVSVGPAWRLSHLKYGCFAKSLSEALRWGFLLKNSMVVKSDSKQGNECNRIQILGSIKAMRP